MSGRKIFNMLLKSRATLCNYMSLTLVSDSMHSTHTPGSLDVAFLKHVQGKSSHNFLQSSILVSNSPPLPHSCFSLWLIFPLSSLHLSSSYSALYNSVLTHTMPSNSEARWGAPSPTDFGLSPIRDPTSLYWKSSLLLWELLASFHLHSANNIYSSWQRPMLSKR